MSSSRLSWLPARSSQNKAALFALIVVPLWINLVSPGTLQAGVGKITAQIDARLKELGILSAAGTYTSGGLSNGSFTELEFAGGGKIVEDVDMVDAFYFRTDDGAAFLKRSTSERVPVSVSEVWLGSGGTETKLKNSNGALTGTSGTPFKLTAPASQELQLGSGANDAIWRITTGGHLWPGASFDNSLDIGTNSCRARTGYFGTNVQTPQVTLGSGGPTLTASGSTTVVSGSLQFGTGGSTGGVLKSGNLTITPTTSYWSMSGGLVVSGAIVPTTGGIYPGTDNSMDLGRPGSSLGWRGTYTRTLYLGATGAAPSITASGSDVQISGGLDFGASTASVDSRGLLTVTDSNGLAHVVDDVSGELQIADNANYQIARVTIPDGDTAAVEVTLGVEATDGTDYQSSAQHFVVALYNKAGTVGATVQTTTTTSTGAYSTGTLNGAHEAVTRPGSADIQIRYDTSLTPTDMRARFRVRNLSSSSGVTISLLP